jgi:DNA-binding transcriptional regulator GbsR (MarR family)
MTETSVISEETVVKKLPPAIERFVLHWGDMGGQWGVNRSVSQIHAVLYLAEAPMTADDIATTLDMARSNISNSLKELLAWNLIRRVPIRGDRRDHFEAETDIWQIFLRIAIGRKEREIDPAIAVLKSCVSETERDPAVTEIARRRLKEMLAFVELMDGWYSQMLTVPKSSLAPLVRLGARVFSFLPAAKKK